MSAAPASSPAPGSPLLLTLLQARTYVALILVFGFFAIMAPNFLSVANSVIVAKHAALTAFLAIGMTFVIITGGIDLSVGSTVGLCSMVSGWLILYGIDLGTVGTMQFNTLEITLIVMCVGVFVGFVNGILITKLNVAPFIATLGTLYIARGAALLSSGGRTFPNLSGNPDYGSASFPAIGAGTFLGLPVQIWMLIAVGLVAAYIAKRTPLGRHIYAVGGNERGAALSGVKVNRVKLFVYMFSGFCAAIVGLIIASQLQAAHPATGETFELNAIAAAVLGGTSLSGGRGKIGGTIVGAFVISILSDGLVMMSVSSFWQTVIKGLVIVAAVVIDQAQSKLQARVALQQEAALGR
ncbi:ABC transporter permease [Rhodobacter capsulatus]|jgi:erythritol transport system permease protein|uniref:Monosacharide ABC transporter, permease protein n=1 Tax=Rhodobacter capsulatus (strain ATCC BAA-309 / NBRC 16581 / SB1003) TaxID=272942 RepID=D5ANA0_RHOCB|nr:ABC transporter permease [Rhodobacter capsulatus]ADE86390.1 monosacharide ABC transporter, permease protein [Rhodobacter capsulatus SB 1003]ETD00640.1 sugar ABC transporter permease [Rhodobacter capsulatus DE442]ETD75272.1 sugar ABC transporter permease [Rhodobacter capsulatus R121]ETD76144.1 sugar ABC transporter permease [Rhodobacter capsulatus B6]ETD82094.1 sugar ABC transporter permease [Rhodobacter capsulatus YW1]